MQIMMALGDHAFSLHQTAYDKIKITATWRWPESQLVGRHPDLQYTGPEAKTLKIEGAVFAAGLKGGVVGRLSQLRALGDSGKPLPLVDGEGNHWGLYVIQQIEETRTHLTMRGAPRKQTWTMTLRYFGARADGVDFEL